MARILYSTAGEGRGQAARIQTIVEALRQQHELIVFAPGKAYNFLSAKYPCGTSNVFVRRIPGLRSLNTRWPLGLMRSVLHAASFARQLRNLVEWFSQLINDSYPALAITDCEPALPQAARQCGVPLIRLDHQQILGSLPALSLLRRGQLHVMDMVRGNLGYRSAVTIVPFFFQTPLRQTYSRIVQVGPLLRPALRNLRPTQEKHLVCCLRKGTPPRILDIFGLCDRDVFVYGYGDRKRDGSVCFREDDEEMFAYDLEGCAAVVGAAGSQLLGESLYLGKPVFALPDRCHHEQFIYAHYLKSMQAGDWMASECADRSDLSRFLRRLNEFEDHASRYRGQLDGTSQALNEVNRFLPQKLRSKQRGFLVGAA